MRTGLGNLPWPTAQNPGRVTSRHPSDSAINRPQSGPDPATPQAPSCPAVRRRRACDLLWMQILRELASERGYFLRREAIELGIDDRRLHRGVRTKQLVRIRQGAYCHRRPLARHVGGTSPPRSGTRHARPPRRSCRRVAHIRACGLRAARCGERLSIASTSLGSTIRHRDWRPAWCTTGAGSAENELVERNGRLVTSPTRSLLDAFTLLETPSAMVAGDWMLREGLTTHEQLWAGKDAMHRWPSTLSQELVIRLLDGAQPDRSARPWRDSCSGACIFLVPCFSSAIYDSHGQLIGITDFAWPKHGVYGEFDGRVKYGRLLKPGQDPGDACSRRSDART